MIIAVVAAAFLSNASAIGYPGGDNNYASNMEGYIGTPYRNTFPIFQGVDGEGAHFATPISRFYDRAILSLAFVSAVTFLLFIGPGYRSPKGGISRLSGARMNYRLLNLMRPETNETDNGGSRRISLIFLEYLANNMECKRRIHE
ncbi:hypothetical protein KM043_018727 [Ampulex compressa]|nr:hypothetical protein KM043_018727 [Ampulex compressa]